MSHQAIRYLAQWQFEHIKIVPRLDREEEALRLAAQCRADATKAGISNEALDAAAVGNLIADMLQALDAAEFRRMCRDQWADQEGGALS